MKKSSLSRFKDNVNFAISKTKKPLVWIEAFDYSFVLDTICSIGSNGWIWNESSGIVNDLQTKAKIADNRQQILSTDTLSDSIKYFSTQPTFPILVARVTNLLFFADQKLISSLQDFVYNNNQKENDNKQTIVLISNTHFEVSGLEHICERLTLPKPDKDDIQEMLGFYLKKNNDGNLSISGEGNPVYPFAYDFRKSGHFAQYYEEFIDALYGMYRYDIEELLHTLISGSRIKAIQYYYSESEGGALMARIKAVKKQMVKNSGLLEFIDYEKGVDREVEDIGNLKEHLEMERDCMSNQAFLKSKLRKPKGILLVGAPGCGKSASAKAAASILKLDLYRLNIGDLLGHKYGQSENQFNEALRTADASAPCVLWIDEIEKAFAGAGNSRNDDNTLTHIVGRFLTWMQEHETLVYLVATANDLSDLKPEMKRKGRWDEIFYLVYPGKEGREKILNACIKKYDLKDNDLLKKILFENVDKMIKMSGAEIESLVVNIAKDYFRYNKQDGVKEHEKRLSTKMNDYISSGTDECTYERFKSKIEDEYQKSGYKPASNNPLDYMI